MACYLEVPGNALCDIILTVAWMQSAAMMSWKEIIYLIGGKIATILLVAEPDVLEGLLGACLETTSARGNKEPHESPCWGSLPSGGLWLLCSRVRPECLFWQEQVTFGLCGDSPFWNVLKAVALPDKHWNSSTCKLWQSFLVDVFGFTAKLRLKESCSSAIKEVALKLFTAEIVIFWFTPQSLLVICAGLILWVSSFIWTWSEPSRSAGLFGASAECQAATKPSPCQDGLRHFLHVWPWCYVHRKAR